MSVEVKFFRVLDRATEISAMVTKILTPYSPRDTGNCVL